MSRDRLQSAQPDIRSLSAGAWGLRALNPTSHRPEARLTIESVEPQSCYRNPEFYYTVEAEKLETS